VQYEDRIAIGTPEGVELELVLAGLGSRFVATLLDLLIKAGAVILFVILLLIVNAAGGASSTVIAVTAILVAFSALFVYDVLFEVWGGGRTPGKRATGLRVIRDGGSPVNLTASLVRNILRLIDFLPSAYLVGIICITVTSTNKRLGDLVAGTIVVRERRETPPGAPWSPPTWVVEESRSWDVSGVTQDEAAAVARFVERRGSLEWAARNQIAMQLAGRLYPKVRGAASNLQAEAFLERLLTAKRART
jgi:uncharacterized RDD family membrane protein YckC